MAKKERIELVCYTDYGSNSIVEPRPLFNKANELGMRGIAITDYGIVDAFPYYTADYINNTGLNREPFKVMYGLKAQVFDDTNCKVPPCDFAHTSCLATYEILLLAKNQQGIRDIYHLVTLSQKLDLGVYLRMSDILNCKENLLLGFEARDLLIYYEDSEEKNEKYEGWQEYHISCQQYRLEFVRNFDFVLVEPTFNIRYSWSDYFKKPENVERTFKRMITDFDAIGIPIVATGEVRYVNPEDKVGYEILSYHQSERLNRSGKSKHHLLSTEEMLEAFSYLGKKKAKEIVVDNSNAVFDMIEYVNPIDNTPQYPIIKNADKTIKKICKERLTELYGAKPDKRITERLDLELNAISEKGYATYFLLIYRLTQKCREDGYYYDTRGCAGASFVCYLLEITESNPLEPHYRCDSCHYTDFEGKWHEKLTIDSIGPDLPNKKCPVCGKKLTKDGYNLPYETFFGAHMDRKPCIDLSFAYEYRNRIVDYLKSMDEIEDVYASGDHTLLWEEDAFAWAKDYFQTKKSKKTDEQIRETAKKLYWKKNKLSAEPSFIIVPKGVDINDYSPLREFKESGMGEYITPFSYYKTLDNFMHISLYRQPIGTVLKELERETGYNARKVSLQDSKVMSLFSGCGSLGLKPEQLRGNDIGNLGCMYFDEPAAFLNNLKAGSFSEIIHIWGMCHNTYFYDDNASEPGFDYEDIYHNNPIAHREDIMNYLISLGMDRVSAFQVMDFVRKGKASIGRRREKWEELVGKMRQYDVPDSYIKSCECIRYLFPRAHSANMFLLAWKLLYYKLHFPEVYYKVWFKYMTEYVDAKFLKKGKLYAQKKYDELAERLDKKGISDEEAYQMVDYLVVVEMYERGVDVTKIATEKQFDRNKEYEFVNSFSVLGKK